MATSGAPLQTAAESVSGAGQQMSGLSGQLVDRHASVVQQQNRELVTAGRTDSTLEARLANAAQITEGGARQMDTIVAQTRSIAEVAGSARTPAAEMMVLKLCGRRSPAPSRWWLRLSSSPARPPER